MIALTLRHYCSRFGWEIAAFWLISLTNSGLLLGNPPSGLLSATAVLEMVALAWITMRLVLAEDGFRTSGGWQVRPFPLPVRHLLPLGLACAVVFLPALIRQFAFQRLFPGAAWLDPGIGSWMWQFGGWLIFVALPIKLFGLLILQGVEGRAKSAAWAVLALVVLPLIAMTGAGFVDKRQRRHFSQSGDGEPRSLAQGIQRELSGSADFIGVWNDPIREPEVQSARILIRIPLDSGSPATGVSIRSIATSLRGAQVNVGLRVLLADPKLSTRLERAIPVLRYADGSVATCAKRRSSDLGPPLPLVRTTEWRFSGDFVSPLSLPEFEGNPADLTRGLELLFFIPDWNRPWMKTDPKSYRPDFRNEPEFRFAPRTMEDLFVQFPWPDLVLAKTAVPFLRAHATKDDIPLLLDHLRADTRLAEFFFQMGWTADAMPVLRELAKERIPMPPSALIALAREKDPALTDDLAALALDQNFNINELEPALRTQPGFDWPKFVKELWRRKKYTTNWLQPYGEFWQPALWAAQEGDFTAFRETAEQAARGHKWEKERLADLVDERHEDLIGYLRKNIGRMKFDPTTRKWGP
jgi:hypothetical protein